MTTKIAFITGISGQDGAYLADLLLKCEYKVYGSTRSLNTFDSTRLINLGIWNNVKIVEMNGCCAESVHQALSSVTPSLIFNLAGQSSVGQSIVSPYSAFNSIVTGTLNILEYLKKNPDNVRFFNAGSTECFGPASKQSPHNELSPFNPQSPYAIAKAAAFWLVIRYREAYKIHCCTGLFGNHESYLRGNAYALPSLINQAILYKKKRTQVINTGNLGIFRDWGWAPEYMYAAYLLLQQDEPQDAIIASGVSLNLNDALYYIIDKLNIANPSIQMSDHLVRIMDYEKSFVDPTLIKDLTGWKSAINGFTLIDKLCEHYVNNCEL